MVISEFSTQYAAQRNAYQVRQTSSAAGVVYLLPGRIKLYTVKPIIWFLPHRVCYVQCTSAWPPVLFWLAKAFESSSCQECPPSKVTDEDRFPSSMGHGM